MIKNAPIASSRAARNAPLTDLQQDSFLRVLLYRFDSLVATAVHLDSSQVSVSGGVMTLNPVQSFTTLRVLDSLIVGRSGRPPIDTLPHGPDSTIYDTLGFDKRWPGVLDSIPNPDYKGLLIGGDLPGSGLSTGSSNLKITTKKHPRKKKIKHHLF